MTCCVDHDEYIYLEMATSREPQATNTFFTKAKAQSALLLVKSYN